MKSRIFYTQTSIDIADNIKTFLNNYPDFLTPDTGTSPRAAGDAIQHILEENFAQIIGDLSKEYSANFARRAMADLAFTDFEDLYYIVDVKTHRLETKFNMPNLTSVERLARFYEDNHNYFVVLMIAYTVSGVDVNVESVYFVPIEFLSWQCLTIGALGWGQIQIANANNLIVNTGYSRKKWMLELCDALDEFYPREIEKVKNRIHHFKQVREQWEEKVDVWEL